MSLVYRGNGDWGTGKGSKLTPAEVDGNFYTLKALIDDVTANVPVGVGVASISVAGTALTFHMTDSSDLGPIQIPTLRFRWRGDYVPGMDFLEQDTFKVDGIGVFWVLQPHTAADPFDPDAVGDDTNPLYFQLFGVSNLTTLGDLADVDVDAVSDGDLLQWNAGSATWLPASPAGVTVLPTISAGTLLGNSTSSTGPAAEATLSDLIDQAIGDTRGGILHRGSAGWELLSPGSSGTVLTANGADADLSYVSGGGSVSTLDDLSDVAISSPADGEALVYNSGTGQWENTVVSGGGGGGAVALDDLTDVTTSGATSGSVLGYDGSTWGPTSGGGGGGGGGSGLYAPLISTVPTQANTGFNTWLNQGSATVTDGDAGLSIRAPSTSLNLRGLTQTAPGTPYTKRFLVALSCAPSLYNQVGVGWYDGTNKLQFIGLAFDGSSPGAWYLAVSHWSTPSDFVNRDYGLVPAMGNPVWFSLSDDGTNISFGISQSGASGDFIPVYSVAKASGYLGSSGYSNLLFFTNRENTGGSQDAVGTLMAML